MSRMVKEEPFSVSYSVEFRWSFDDYWWTGMPSMDMAFGSAEGTYSLDTVRALIKRSKGRDKRHYRAGVEYRIIKHTREVVG